MLRRREASQEPSLPSGDFGARIGRILATTQRTAPEAASGVDAPRAEAMATLRAAIATLGEAGGAVRQAANHVITAATETDPARRALLAEHYDDARRAVDEIAPRAAAAAPLLAADATRLEVSLRGATYAVSPFPLTTGEDGLDLPPPEDGFASQVEVADTLRRVELALERLASARSVYAGDLSFLTPDA